MVINLARGETVRRNTLLRQLVEIHYERNDTELKRGAFRVRGDTLEVLAGLRRDRLPRRPVRRRDRAHPRDTIRSPAKSWRDHAKIDIFPAKHFITEEDKLKRSHHAIEQELERAAWPTSSRNDKLLEAQRIEQRTRYDLEMLREVGYCSGIENYSRPWTGARPARRPGR